MKNVVRVVLLCLFLSSPSALQAQQPCSETVFVADNLILGDCFGFAFAREHDVMVVGAHQRSEGAQSSGAAFVFERIGGGWTEVQKLTSGDPIFAQFFGHEVATNGASIFVQAERHSPSASPLGGSAISVFKKQAGSWTLVQRLVDTQNTTGTVDNFGFDLELDDGRLFATNLGANAVHVFEEQGGTWLETDRIESADLPPEYVASLQNGSFGYRIDVEGSRMVVSNSGMTRAAFVFEHDGAHWQPTAQLLGPSLQFWALRHL